MLSLKKFWSQSAASKWQRVFYFGPALWFAVVAPTAFAFLWDGPDHTLKWDIFLACLPIFLAWVVFWLATSRWSTLWLVPAIAVWLLFFPNSPYLLTQFVHFQPSFTPQSTLEWEPWNVYLHITAVAVAGLLLTLTSMRIVETAVVRRMGRLTAGLVVVAAIVLASFGVALGRIARLNSWDPFVQPTETLERILSYARDVRYQNATVVMAMLLLSVYVATRQMAVARSNPKLASK